MGTAPDSLTSENQTQFVTVTADTLPGYNTTGQARQVKKTLDAYTPVSYTHLDVYKRQFLQRHAALARGGAILQKIARVKLDARLGGVHRHADAAFLAGSPGEMCIRDRSAAAPLSSRILAPPRALRPMPATAT